MAPIALAWALIGCSGAGKHAEIDAGSGQTPAGSGGAAGSAAASNIAGGRGSGTGGQPNAGAGSAGSASVAGRGGSAGGAGGRAGNAGSSGGRGGSASGGGGASGANAGAGGGTSGAGGGGAGSGGGGSLVNPAPGSKFFVGANFWNIEWEGSDDFFASGTDFATTTNPWRPELLDDLAPYHVLRFMDWNLTNDSNNPQAHWATRTQKTAAQKEPVAFEWQIDLCNRTHKDYWLNIPHEATPDDWQKIAGLVHDQLDPSLRLYLEWSNEVWNGSFPQHGYAGNQAQSLGLPGSDAAAAYYVYASVRLYEAFEAVFGKGSPRLVKVLAGQAAWTGPCEAHVTALGDTKINPAGTKPDVYAVAPYFSGSSIQALGNALSMTAQWTSDSYDCAAKIGLPLISYEGGSDSYAASGNGCTMLQHDSGMHDLYMHYLDGLSGANMSGPFMQYTHTGDCWGLKQKTSDSLANSPKYKGVLDWLAAHP